MAIAKTVTIDPPSTDLVLGPADVLDESIKGSVPAGNSLRNMRLVRSASIAPFVGAVTPAGGYGPWPGRAARTFAFRMQFHGIAVTAVHTATGRAARRRRASRQSRRACRACAARVTRSAGPRAALAADLL